MLRLVNLVNEKDEIIGQTDLLDAHRGVGKKHQAISWFLFRQSDLGFELLVQQRSQQKIVGALAWANTLCANVAPGETHRQCLERRSWEELGLRWQEDWNAQEIMVLEYQVACETGFSENELDHFFVTVLRHSQATRLQLAPNPEEVLDYQWVSWDVVQQQKFPESMVIAPWFALFLNNKQVLAAINQELIYGHS